MSENVSDQTEQLRKSNSIFGFQFGPNYALSVLHIIYNTIQMAIGTSLRSVNWLINNVIGGILPQQIHGPQPERSSQIEN